MNWTRLTFLIATCALIPCLHAAEGFAATATATLQVSVTIRPWMKFNADQKMHTYQVTRSDIEKGYVDLPGSAEINIRTNERKNVAIIVVNEGPEKLQVREANVGAYTETSSALDIGRQIPGIPLIKKLDYRVILPEGTMEGQYALNVTIAPHIY